MKKFLTFLTVFALLFLTFSVKTTYAKVIANDKGSVTVAKNEVINDDLFVGAQSVEIEGVINGDVFVGAESVKINGTVNGNLHVGAGVIDLGGVVKGNTYLAGKDINLINAKVGGSLLVAGANVNIDKDCIVNGSLLTGAGQFAVDSQIKRSLYVGAGSLVVGENTKIGKDFYYASGNNNGSVNVSTKAKIVGSTYKSEVDTVKRSEEIESFKKDIPNFLKGVKFVSTSVSFICAVFVGYLYLKFFGKHSAKSSELITTSFWKSVGVGLLAVVLVLPITLILLISVVGMPLIGVGLMLFFLFSYMAKIVVSLPIGNFVNKKFGWKLNNFWMSVVGLVIIYVFKSIPVVGGIFGMFVYWAGLGALILYMLTGEKNA